MAKAILYNDLWDFYDHDGAETRCFYLPIEEEELEPYLVDYEPVIHAHWIKLYNHIKCSNCGVVFFNQPSDKFKTYCSKCGAKMDEVV